MRKLKLDPETLHVESFAPRDGQAAARGTVQAQSYVTFFGDMSACSEPASQYCQETDFHWNTCGNSCVNMCFPTGNDPACYD
jgi:hypothetical protein